MAIECVIPQTFHRTVMGARGANVQEITTNFEVGIKFPDRPAANGGMYGIFGGKTLNVQCCVTDFTLLHSERSKLHRALAVLNTVRSTCIFKHVSYSGYLY